MDNDDIQNHDRADRGCANDAEEQVHCSKPALFALLSKSLLANVSAETRPDEPFNPQPTLWPRHAALLVAEETYNNPWQATPAEARPRQLSEGSAGFDGEGRFARLHAEPIEALERSRLHNHRDYIGWLISFLAAAILIILGSTL